MEVKITVPAKSMQVSAEPSNKSTGRRICAECHTPVGSHKAFSSKRKSFHWVLGTSKTMRKIHVIAYRTKNPADLKPMYFNHILR